MSDINACEIDLKNIKTCQLVSELKKREGVDTIVVPNYQKVNMIIEGEATVLKVID